ncbi:LysE family transporter [Paenibacillus sp. XY044]|uniref:LysE family transporter n=1 Tax=Paenibacillus sp. XY044 TaxID=2026089 RepID=UPI0015C646E3|nr:LysE family transporter [Paenibacillus sp. XY044]
MDWLTIVVIGLLAVMTPGPNLAITIRNSLFFSRKAGIYTAVGLATGNLIHATYCLIGIGVLITQSILLFNTLKWLGAIFLLYIGYKSLRAKPYSEQQVLENSRHVMTPLTAFRNGFLTNLLNPKVALFFLALFTQIIQPNTPQLIQALYGLTMVSLEFTWFTLVSLLISQDFIRKPFMSISHWVERITGAVLIGLGLRLLFLKRN